MIKVPKFFHDILGEETRGYAIGLITLTTALIMGYLMVEEGELFVASGTIAGVIGFILLADIIAGTVANFTKGTNNFYAKRALNRWIFIAIHVQPVIISWLLGFNMTHAIIVWLFTILAAVIVNLMMGKSYQREVAGTFMALGIFLSVVLYMGVSMVALTMGIFFSIKVIYSFAVDHEREEQDD